MWQDLKNIYHLVQAMAANILNGFPSRKIIVIGITGTDGKTTTCHMLYRILRGAGMKTIVITTVGALINDKPYSIGTHVTTPSSFTIQKLLRTAIRQGCTHAIIETTSHALHQNRVVGIHFSIGILTNITPEHLDYHKTFERYIEAKSKLLTKADTAIINYDDRSYALVAPMLSMTKTITYSMVNQKATYTPRKNPLTLKVLGDFNVMNALAAYAAATKLGIDPETIKKNLESFTAPKGRQEIVYDADFRVIVDFAHTPNALENLFRAARASGKGRLIAVFGSAGKRDKKKRPEMGRAAARYADIIILTADDPRDEHIDDINRMIARGIEGFTAVEPDVATTEKKLLYQTTDRQQGINLAVRIATAGDTIVLAGIGHVQALAMKDGDIPWDERAAVERAIAARTSASSEAS